MFLSKFFPQDNPIQLGSSILIILLSIAVLVLSIFLATRDDDCVPVGEILHVDTRRALGNYTI